MEFKIKSDNPWDKILIPEGKELAVGTKVYNGSRLMLVGGQETEVAEPCYGGEYPLDNGKYIVVVDGVITEINDLPASAKISMKAEAKKRAASYKGK